MSNIGFSSNSLISAWSTSGGFWVQTSYPRNHYDGGSIDASYVQDSAAATADIVPVDVPPLIVDLCPDFSDAIVPGSVLFTLGSSQYVDREGTLYRDIEALTGAGTLAGVINYETGECTISNWGAGGNAPTVQAMLTRYGQYQVSDLAFRTAAVPVLPGLQVRANKLDGTQIVAETDNNGDFSGDFAGTLDADSGVVLLDFGTDAILPDTIRYSGTATKSLPLEAALLGLDPVRLPADGRVVVLRVGDMALLHDTVATVFPNPIVADTAYDLGHVDVDDVEVRDADGDLVADTNYTVDYGAGQITFPSPLDLSGYTQPLTASDRIEFTGLVDDVQINGLINFNSDIPRAFPATALVSGVLPFGDLQAACPVFFDQTTWNNIFADTTTGNSTATYDTINHPIELTNADAVTERFVLVFTSATAFNVIGETLGQIGTGTTTVDVAPINPNTAAPYFTLRKEGFGSGWATNRAIRFNITASFAPIWVSRTILSGAAEYDEDGFRIQARGDSN